MQIEEKEYIVSDLESMSIVTDLLSQEKVKYLAVESFVCWFKPFSTPTIFSVGSLQFIAGLLVVQHP